MGTLSTMVTSLAEIPKVKEKQAAENCQVSEKSQHQRRTPTSRKRINEEGSRIN
jgi:hypothetical protein